MIKPGRWDLSSLVGQPSELEERVERIKNLAESFGKLREDLDPEMPSEEFGGILQRIENLTEESSMATGYASLMYAADTQSDEATSLLTRMRKLGADISNQVLFFDLWWMRTVDETNARRLMGDAGDLTEYLRHLRLVASYSLSEPEEKIINTLDVTGTSALVKIYDKITGSFKYRARGKSMSREELSGLFKSSNPEVRKTAYDALLDKFAGQKGVLGEIYQNVVLNWRDEGIQIRGYKTPISIRNVDNNVDDITVDSLLRVCKNNSSVFHEFFLHKAELLGVEQLRRYDLYAPVAAKSRERRYSYDRSVRLVLESLAEFSPRLSDFARSVFDQNHVDSVLRPGKRDGAFCSTISPKVVPFVFVNFTGKLRDVFTLAHELGHAVHSLAAADRSILVQHASLPLAETASTFSELLLYDRLAEMMPEGEERNMLAVEIDDLYASILRQSFFTLFEIDAHRQIAKSTTIDELSDTYLRNLRQQLGDSVDVSDNFAREWICIPHFYHSPFYCYAYSFGNLLALSLFQRYKREGADFVPSYLEILSAGGSKKPELLLSEYGMDIASEQFWQDGFDYIRQQIRRLSTMN